MERGVNYEEKKDFTYEEGKNDIKSKKVVLMQLTDTSDVENPVEETQLDRIEKDISFIRKKRVGLGLPLMTYLMTLTLPYIALNVTTTSDFNNLKTEFQNSKKEIPQVKYINNDTLADLVYNNGDTYLQTPAGTFVMLNKSKIDSIYAAKLDSVKKEYASGLSEKIDAIEKEKQNFMQGSTKKK